MPRETARASIVEARDLVLDGEAETAMLETMMVETVMLEIVILDAVMLGTEMLDSVMLEVGDAPWEDVVALSCLPRFWSDMLYPKYRRRAELTCTQCSQEV